jgi:DMSO/TMAO reductase YedYZ molybdopterin-dependent catalytic subunit
MITRRKLFGAFGAAALAACDSKKPRKGALGAMERWNRDVQSGLFRSDLQVSGGDKTPEEDFPIYYISNEPPHAPAGWTLDVGGMVDRPMKLTLDDLKAMRRTDVRIEHHCVEGWSATADWHGVRVRDLAERVGARRVGYVEFKSFDSGYWSSWDRDSAFHPQTLIAYGMDGEDLTVSHGAPVRVYGAVKLGYKQVKYLSAVNFLDRETGGYWENLGYEWYAGV